MAPCSSAPGVCWYKGCQQDAGTLPLAPLLALFTVVGWRASWDGHRRPVSAAPRAAGLRRFVTRTQGACARCPCSLNYLGKQHAARRLRGGRRQAAGWAPRGGRVGRLMFTCADPVLHPPPCRPFGVSLSRGAAAVAAARRGADLPAGERAPAGGGRGRAHSAAQRRPSAHRLARARHAAQASWLRAQEAATTSCLLVSCSLSAGCDTCNEECAPRRCQRCRRHTELSFQMAC